MLANASVADRCRVQLRSVNADDLLNRLMGLGIAREMPNRPGIRRSVRVNRIEVAIAEKPGERSLRARWREHADKMDFRYLLVIDDPDHPDSVRTLGPRTYNEPIRSVDCAQLSTAIEATAPMHNLDAVRHLAGEVIRLAGRGKVVHGLLTHHTLEARFPRPPRPMGRRRRDNPRTIGDRRLENAAARNGIRDREAPPARVPGPLQRPAGGLGPPLGHAPAFRPGRRHGSPR